MSLEFRKVMRIGVNHHLLCKFLATSNRAHRDTLLPILQDPRFDVFDLWIVGEEPYKSDEIKAIRDCGRPVIYNVGDRAGRQIMYPTAKEPSARRYALDSFKAEIERGLEVGTKKVVTSSGPKHMVSDEEAFEALIDFYCELCRFVPPDVRILIEPTDTDFDKRFFMGSSRETRRLIGEIKARGCENIGGMIDMCHLPQLGETVISAVEDMGSDLRHVHLGTCVMEDSDNPYYGDKHPAWGQPGVIWGQAEVVEMISEGLRTGYFGEKERGTASFEMVAYEDAPYLESLDRFIAFMDQCWAAYGEVRA